MNGNIYFKNMKNGVFGYRFILYRKMGRWKRFKFCVSISSREIRAIFTVASTVKIRSSELQVIIRQKWLLIRDWGDTCHKIYQCYSIAKTFLYMVKNFHICYLQSQVFFCCRVSYVMCPNVSSCVECRHGQGVMLHAF